MNDDGELLRRFAARHDETCFARLVQRHLGFVYAVCMRRLRDHHAAQDATQAVFVALARKAAAVASGPSVIGWLHRSACYETNNLMRARAHQLARDTEAQRLGTTAPESPIDLQVLSAVLDEALLKLPNADREAVLARYFSGLSYAELGASLKLSENAARMRVDRAVLKLRGQLSLRGFTSTALVLAEAMPTFASAAAPNGLASGVTKAAMAGVAASSGTVATLIESMSITKLVVGIALAASASGAVYEYRQLAQKPSSAPATAAQLPLAAVASEVAPFQPVSTSSGNAAAASPSAAASTSSGVIPKPPKGWFKNGSAPALFEVGVDQTNSWGGMPSAYIKSIQPIDRKFGGMMQVISAAAYLGQRVQLTGWIKTQDATGNGAHLWMRIDGKPKEMLGFDNMDGRAPLGTTDWQEYSLVLDVPAGATRINYGMFLEGDGEMWVNGVTVSAVGPEVPTTNQLDGQQTGLPSTPTNLGFTPPSKD